MVSRENEFENEFNLEFIKSLHDEKMKTQSERATYVTSKFAFIAGLAGISALKTDKMDFHWLLYLIPIVAIGYDLYIRAADLSIKRIGAFLRRHPKAGVSEAEKAWEIFTAQYRDSFKRTATTLFSYVIILSAAIAIFLQQRMVTNEYFWVGFLLWLGACMLTNTVLWISHTKQVKRFDNYEFNNPPDKK